MRVGVVAEVQPRAFLRTVSRAAPTAHDLANFEPRALLLDYRLYDAVAGTLLLSRVWAHTGGYIVPNVHKMIM